VGKEITMGQQARKAPDEPKQPQELTPEEIEEQEAAELPERERCR